MGSAAEVVPLLNTTKMEYATKITGINIGVENNTKTTAIKLIHIVLVLWQVIYWKDALLALNILDNRSLAYLLSTKCTHTATEIIAMTSVSLEAVHSNNNMAVADFDHNNHRAYNNVYCSLVGMVSESLLMPQIKIDCNFRTLYESYFG